VGTITKLVRPIRKQNQPILLAMKKARRFKELKVSNVNWAVLSNDLSHDVIASTITDEICDDRMLKRRIERARDYQQAIQTVKEKYQEDLTDGRIISTSYPWGEHPGRKGRFVPPPDPLATLSNFERGAEDALKHLRNIERLQKTNDQDFIELGEQKFLYAVTLRMVKTFEHHFEVEPKPYTSRTKKPRRDGPFLRMAQFALREYGGRDYKLNSIATELDKILAARRAQKEHSSVPASV
jgi:hypothetical protein